MMMVMMTDITIPIKGAKTMKEAILPMTSPFTASVPNVSYPLPIMALIIAAPANPPIRVWDEEEGMPNHQVAKFQIMAAMIPEKMTGSVIKVSTTDLDTVLAIPNSPIIYLAIKKATKLKVAAHSTA